MEMLILGFLVIAPFFLPLTKWNHRSNHRKIVSPQQETFFQNGNFSVTKCWVEWFHFLNVARQFNPPGSWASKVKPTDVTVGKSVVRILRKWLLRGLYSSAQLEAISTLTLQDRFVPTWRISKNCNTTATMVIIHDHPLEIEGTHFQAHLHSKWV